MKTYSDIVQNLRDRADEIERLSIKQSTLKSVLTDPISNYCDFKLGGTNVNGLISQEMYLSLKKDIILFLRESLTETETLLEDYTDE